jgi:hypothetical protein
MTCASVRGRDISNFEILPLLVRSYSSKSARHFRMKESFFREDKAKIKYPAPR